MGEFSTLNFKKWIDENRHLLKPPVGNKMIWTDREFIVMVVGGPNTRTDYHINKGEEFFHQIEGDMTLKVVNSKGDFEDVEIRQGEIFLLPPNVPHSPQRKENTVGLVVERKRFENELDGFAWYCQNCKAKLYQEDVKMTNIEKDLPPVFERFYKNENHRTCKSCHTKHDDKGMMIK